MQYLPDIRFISNRIGNVFDVRQLDNRSQFCSEMQLMERPRAIVCYSLDQEHILVNTYDQDRSPLDILLQESCTNSFINNAYFFLQPFCEQHQYVSFSIYMNQSRLQCTYQPTDELIRLFWFQHNDPTQPMLPIEAETR